MEKDILCKVCGAKTDAHFDINLNKVPVCLRCVRVIFGQIFTYYEHNRFDVKLKVEEE